MRNGGWCPVDGKILSDGRRVPLHEPIELTWSQETLDHYRGVISALLRDDLPQTSTSTKGMRLHYKVN